jgi:hypothetical protein
MKPADLGNAFAGPARSAGLGGRLAPLRAAPTTPVVDPPPAEAPVEPPRPAKAKAPRAAAPKPVSRDAVDSGPGPRAVPSVADESSGALQVTAIYISAAIRERLRTTAGERTYTEIVLEAIESSLDQLRARFNTVARSSSMFSGRARPQNKAHAEPFVQVTIRPLRDDLAIVDGLVEQLGAPSRSALISAALEIFLPAGPSS